MPSSNRNTKLKQQARALLSANQAAAAQALLRKAVAKNDRDAEMWGLLAACHGMRGDYAGCETYCRKALAVEPKNFLAWNNLANALVHQGRLADAETAYCRALDIEPRYAEGYNNLGNLQRLGGRHADAEKNYTKALALQTRYLNARVNLANCLHEQGRLDEAISHYREALSIEPAHPKALLDLARALVSRWHYREAVPVLSKLVGMQPNHIDAWGMLGDAHGQLKQHDQAIECFERVIALKPNCAEAYFALGRIRQATGALDNAAEMYRTALKFQPDMEEANYLLSTLGGAAIPERAPTRYVSQVFDEYAEHFDEHLSDELRCNVPRLLYDAVIPHVADNDGKLQILDLGCGTGLGGIPFRAHAHHLTGVDLSARMIDKARQRGIYDELIVGELLSPLRRENIRYDIVIAADVFVYIGDLSDIFAAVAQSLRPGGLFAFSTELTTDNHYVVQPNTRYAHSTSYLRTLSTNHGLLEISMHEETLRTEAGTPVRGNICVLHKP